MNCSFKGFVFMVEMSMCRLQCCEGKCRDYWIWRIIMDYAQWMFLATAHLNTPSVLVKGCGHNCNIFPVWESLLHTGLKYRHFTCVCYCTVGRTCFPIGSSTGSVQLLSSGHSNRVNICHFNAYKFLFTCKQIRAHSCRLKNSAAVVQAKKS